MARLFSAMIDLAVDTAKAQASIKDLGSTKAVIPIEMEAAAAKRQAEATLSLVDRLDRKNVSPNVDTSGLRQAKTQVQGLDKALDQVVRQRKMEIKTNLSNAAQAFGAGQSVRGGGIGGMMYGASALSGMGGAGLAMAGAGAATAVIGASAGMMLSRAISEQKLKSFMGRAYGAGGAEFVATAEQLSRSTGFLADDFMRAALIGKTLANNYGLQNEQVAKLVAVSADLAATSPYEDIQTTANAMERLQSAVRGEAEASERLGLTLNDTYMKNIAFGGSLKDTWEKLSDVEKAQYRYKEILNQTKDVLGAAEDEGMSKSLRQAQQRFTEAGTALTEKLLPALSRLVELAASIPAGAYEAAMWGGLALGGGLLGRGAFRMGRSLLGRVGTEAAGEAVAEAAAKAVTSTVKAAGTKAVAEAATQAASAAAGNVTGTLIAQSAVSAISTVGGLAAIAAAAALVAWSIKDIAADTDANYATAAARDEQNELLRRYTQQRTIGADWGVYRDESGKYVQGTIQGVDRPVGTSSYTSQIMVNGQPRTGVIVGSEHYVNKFGQATGQPYYGQYAQAPLIDVRVKLDNMSGQPLKATDARSYDISNF
jgi:hypothetical protein